MKQQPSNSEGRRARTPLILSLLAIAFGCADKAAPEFSKCIQHEAVGELAKAWDACSAAVTADPSSTGGKEAAAKLHAIKRRIDQETAEEEAKQKAAAEARSKAEAEAKAKEAERIRPLLAQAEPVLKECLPIWRKAETKTECQHRYFVAARGDVWAMLQQCGDFEEINKAKEKLKKSLRTITDQLGSHPEAAVIEQRLEAACENGEYDAPK